MNFDYDVKKMVLGPGSLPKWVPFFSAVSHSKLITTKNHEI